MSRASESEHATSHAAHRGPPSADLDAEHDPEVSRRASLAGLHREIGLSAKPGGPGAGRDEDPHSKAERKSVAAIESAITLATARTHERAALILPLTQSLLSEAGADPLLQALQSLFDDVCGDIERLDAQVQTLDPEHRSAVRDEVLRFQGAVEVFSNKWIRAVDFDKAHGETQKLATRTWSKLQEVLMSLHRSVSSNPKLPELPQSSQAKGKADSKELLPSAMEATLEAVTACVTSVKSSQVVSPDLDNLRAHLKELHSMIGQTSLRGSQVARVRNVLAQVKTLDDKLELQLQSVASGVRNQIRMIEDLIRGK